VLLAQSLFAEQDFPFAHVVQFGPPQSTSVSPWFFFPSVQLTQVPFSHALFAQSALVLQGFPSAHTGQAIAVPHPSVTAPHCVLQSLGVQHALLMQTSPAAQFFVQSMLPPQPSPTVGEQDLVGHAVAAVQHLSL